jgi:diguanylate cyclase (GGDEF)-like protein
MPQSDAEQAKVLAERLRATVEQHRLQVGEDQVVDFVRVSIGVGVYPRHSDTMQGVVTAADQAVYKVKDRGGNGIQVAEGLPDGEFPLQNSEQVNRLTAEDGEDRVGKQCG